VIAGQREVGDRCGGVAGKADEQVFAEWVQAGSAAALDGEPGQEVEGLVGGEVECVGDAASLGEDGGNVLHVLEAEPCGEVGDPVVGVAELVDEQPLAQRDVRHVLRLRGDDHDVVVEDVVEGDVGAQGQRRGQLGGVEEHCRARYPGHPAGGEIGPQAVEEVR
jgi:hypothetical protein